MKVVVISGKAQSGKDTTAEFMNAALNSKGYRVIITHYADLLKYICSSFLGWDGNKDEYGRSLLQRVGTEMRNGDENYWVNFIIKILYAFENMWDYVIIPDTRYPNEIDSLIDFGFEVIHIRIERPGFDNGLSESQKLHISETALDGRSANITVVNDGSLTDLYHKARDVVDLLENTIFKHMQNSRQ